jgi:hypothetical protein
MAQLGFATPGMGAVAVSQTNQFLWGGTRSEILETDFQIDSAAEDAGSNNTKVLRAGLAMGRVTATGMLRQFNPAATDGTQVLAGFLKEETPLIDSLGRAQTAFAPIIVKAPVKVRNILILGVVFAGSSNDTGAIRNQLRSRFLLDDEYASGTVPAAANVQHIRRRFTIAEVNAGTALLPALAGVRYRVVDAQMISIGGAVGAATSVDIAATQAASSVNILAVAVAALTQNTLVRAGAANAAILAGGASFVTNDVNTAVVVQKTGSNATTATHVDVLLSYVVE